MNTRHLNFKTCVILGFLLAALAVVSCGESEDFDAQAPEEIFSKWTLVTQILANCSNPANNSQEEKDCTPEECLQFEFKDDLTVTSKDIGEDGTGVRRGEFAVSANQLTMDLGDIFLTFSYELRGDTLNLTFRDNDINCNVIGVFQRTE